jgi:hypothetical protein
MVRRSLKSLLLSRLARWLRPADWAKHWSVLLSRQAERWTPAPHNREAAGDPAADEATVAEEGNPASAGGSPGGPPAHWLARLQQSGQPLPWLEHRSRPMPYRPAGSQPPHAGTRDAGVLQPIPPQVETPYVSQPRPRAGTASPAEDLPEAPSPQQEDRTQVEEAAGRRSLPHPRDTRAVERPARLVPRPRSAEKADTATPADPAPRRQLRLQAQSPERSASQPPGEAEAPETASELQEGGPAERGPERRSAMAATRSEQPRDEAPAVQQSVPPRWSPTQESRPRSTTPVWGQNPMGEAGQVVDTHPLNPQTAEIPRHGDDVLGRLEEAAPSNWPVLDAKHPGHRIPIDRTAKTEVWMGGMALNAHSGESVSLRTHAAAPATDQEAARHRPTEERQLWDEQPSADRWPTLPESSYPGHEASEALTEETWNAQLSAWQRLRRLDEEQRGKPWSA